MVLANIAMREYVVAEPLRVPQAGAMPDHQPGMRPQHSDMIGDIARVRRTGADVDERNAPIAGLDEMKGRHLRHAFWRASAGAAAKPRIARDDIAGRDE